MWHDREYFEASSLGELLMFPIWVYVVVAAVLALIAFGIGQVVPGLGIAFVGLSTTMWTAYVVDRGRRAN